MVDFESNATVLRQHGIVVIAASVDSVEDTQSLVDGLRIRYLTMLSGLDGAAVAESTGAWLEVGGRTHLQPVGLLLNPMGEIINSVYSSGPIGRFSSSDAINKVVFEQVKAAG